MCLFQATLETGWVIFSLLINLLVAVFMTNQTKHQKKKKNDLKKMTIFVWHVDRAVGRYRNLIWALFLMWASPCDVNFAAGGFDGGAVRPPILIYITSRFAYMKHLFCWQSILIFLLYLTSAWIFFFHALATAFSSSTTWKLFALVEFENSAKMHAHSTSFPVLLF